MARKTDKDKGVKFDEAGFIADEADAENLGLMEE
jgi:hypothetical protein